MGYRRPSVIPTPNDLVPKFEASIRSLVLRFRNHPYAFYTENDMHCYLYHRLYAGGLMGEIYRTADGHETILLHKEYPTIARYTRLDDMKLKESKTGRRGRLDISIWDPGLVEQRSHREQKVLCAAELALNECRTGNPHTYNDTIKLSGKINDIAYGYLLYFVRDSTLYLRNKDEIWSGLEDAAKRIRVVFVHVDKGVKPKPIYLGDWGKI